MAPAAVTGVLRDVIGRTATARPVVVLCTVMAAVLLTTPLLRPPVRRPGSTGGDGPRRHRRLGAAVRRPLGIAWNGRIAHRGRSRRVPPDVVAAWCDELARACRSGSALGEAIIRSTPADHRLQHVVEQVALALARGHTLHDALAGVAEPDDRHLDLALAVLSTIARAGGPAARPLERVAATLRLRDADGLDRAAQSAQARLSAKVLMAVPVAALALLLAVDPAVRRIVASPQGAAVVAAGAVLGAVGWWWMAAIVDQGTS